eukprot:scaffold1.g5623.t1
MAKFTTLLVLCLALCGERGRARLHVTAARDLKQATTTYTSFKQLLVQPEFSSLATTLVVTGVMPPANFSDLVAKVLDYHVSPVKALSTDLKPGLSIRTVEGDPLTVATVIPTVTIKPTGDLIATVIKPNAVVDFCVVHVIDTVLLPRVLLPGAPAPAPAPKL